MHHATNGKLTDDPPDARRDTGPSVMGILITFLVGVAFVGFTVTPSREFTPEQRDWHRFKYGVLMLCVCSALTGVGLAIGMCEMTWGEPSCWHPWLR